MVKLNLYLGFQKQIHHFVHDVIDSCKKNDTNKRLRIKVLGQWAKGAPFLVLNTIEFGLR